MRPLHGRSTCSACCIAGNAPLSDQSRPSLPVLPPAWLYDGGAGPVGRSPALPPFPTGKKGSPPGSEPSLPFLHVGKAPSQIKAALPPFSTGGRSTSPETRQPAPPFYYRKEKLPFSSQTVLKTLHVRGKEYKRRYWACGLPSSLEVLQV